MAFRRNIFTGDLEEYNRDKEMAELEQFNAESVERQLEGKYVPTGNHNSAWSRPWVSKNAMRILPEQVAQFNEAAKRNGTGAHYTPEGYCSCDSRQIRNRELKSRGLMDKSGGYGDFTELGPKMPDHLR